MGFRSISIRSKIVLIVTLTATTALLLACTAFIAFNWMEQKQGMVANLQSLAEISGNNCISALEFNDQQTATETLEALQAKGNITAACIFDGHGEVFARYHRGETPFSPPQLQPHGYRFKNRHLSLFHPIIFNGNTVGTIFLEADLQPLYTLTRRYIDVTGLMVLAAALVAVALAALLQRPITKPILALATAARQISEEKDYSLRVEQQGSDEVGTLVQGFNDMLAQIQDRDENLRRSEERFQLAVRGSSDGLWDWNVLSDEVFYSERFKELLGYDEGDPFPHTFASFDDRLHPDDRPRVLAELQHHLAKEGAYHVEYRMLAKDGLFRWFLARGQAVWDKDDVPVRVAGSISDIHDRKAAEAAVRQRDARYRGLILNATDLILVLDRDGSIQYASPSVERVLGHQTDQLAGASFFDYINSDDLSQVSAQHNQTFQTPATPLQSQFRMHHCDGSWRIVSAIFNNLLEDEAVAGIVLNIQDITERKHAERQLAQAHKLESIGQLAAGVAHEINSPMQFINDNNTFLTQAFTDLDGLLGHIEIIAAKGRDNTLAGDWPTQLEEDIEDLDLDFVRKGIPKALNRSAEGIERVIQIIQAMKEFAHPGTKDKTFINLNETIKSAATLSRNEWKYVAELKLNLDPQLPQVCCLPGEISQVLINLIINAAHAIGDKTDAGEKGCITIKSQVREEWLEVQVSDTGTGIPQAVKAKIFDPFFTTKKVGKGTGQGLAIAHDTVAVKHSGELFFETEPGQGTTFFLHLPLNDNNPEALQKEVV